MLFFIRKQYLICKIFISPASKKKLYQNHKFQTQAYESFASPHHFWNEQTPQTPWARHRNMLEIPFYKTATGQRSFLFRAVKLWNNLPEHLKCIDTRYIILKHL